MPTQAQARTAAKSRVRQIKRTLRTVDTKLEVMERRLNKLLERETLIQAKSFDSFLKELSQFFERVRDLERTIQLVMTIFLIF